MCRIDKFSNIHTTYSHIFFQSTKLRQPTEGRDSCLKMNKYHIIFVISTIRYIPNCFSYEKLGTLVTKYVFLVREYPNFIDFHQKIWHLYYQKKMLVVIKYWNVFSGLVERKICSNTSPCKANEGKCILDSHCKDGLSCIKNKCNSLFIDTAIEHTGNISRGFLLVLLVVKRQHHSQTMDLLK